MRGRKPLPEIVREVFEEIYQTTTPPLNINLLTGDEEDFWNLKYKISEELYEIILNRSIDKYNLLPGIELNTFRMKLFFNGLPEIIHKNSPQDT